MALSVSGHSSDSASVDGLISVTYLSSAVELWTDDELAQLLENARRNNQEANVTGVLLYSGGNFIQTLEGPEHSVDRIMGRVLDDGRHTGVLVVRRDELVARAFAEWSMGFQRVSAESVREIPGFTDYLRTGRIEGATARRHAAMTFHRVFREHIRETTPPWNRSAANGSS